MLFHIQATHSNETCLANDPEKKKILRDALKSAEQKGVKFIIWYQVGRLIHFG